MSGDRILLAELSAELARSPFARQITISRKCARAIERALLHRDAFGPALSSGAVPTTAASVRPVQELVGCEGRAPEGSSGRHRGGVATHAVGNKPAKARQAHATVSRSAGPPAPVAPPGQSSTLPPVSQAAPVVSNPQRRRVPVAQRIDLSTARSGLEARFDRASSGRGEAPAPGCGKVYCDCYPEGLVPEWFGRDCIEPGCGLKGCAA